jgi:hypothetical protein
MAALYTEELERLLLQAVVIGGGGGGRRMKMLGVYSADLMPSVDEIRRGCLSTTFSASSSSLCCFAINTDPSHRPGKHWVLFIACQKADGVHLEYFDSYGMPMELYRDLYDSCSNKGLLPLIKQYNTLMLQDVSTTVCGY